MELSDLQWLVTIAVTVFLGWLSSLGAALTWVSRRITGVEQTAKDNDHLIHERVNRVREDMVSKEDMKSLAADIRLQLTEARNEQHKDNADQSRRLDKVLEMMAQWTKGSEK